MALNLSHLRPYLREEETQKQKYRNPDEMLDTIFSESEPVVPVRNVQDKIGRDSAAAVTSAQSPANRANTLLRPSPPAVNNAPFSWRETSEVPETILPRKVEEEFSVAPLQPQQEQVPKKLEELKEELRLVDEDNKEFLEEWNSKRKELRNRNWNRAYDFGRFEEELEYIKDNRSKYRHIDNRRKKLAKEIRVHPETLQIKKNISDGIQELQGRASEELREEYRRHFKEEERQEREHPFISAMSNMRGSMGKVSSPIATDEKIRNLTMAQKFLSDSQTMIEAAEKEKDGTFVGGLGRGVRDKMLNLDTWTMGFTEALKNTSLLLAVEKYERKEKLTSDEENLLTAAAMNVATLEHYASGLGYGYHTGQIVGEAVATALEALATPSLGVGKVVAGKVGKVAVGKMGELALNKALKKVLTQGFPKVAGDVAEAGARTVVYDSPRVVASAAGRRMGNIKYNMGEDGRISFGGTEGGEPLYKALPKAFGATMISESASRFMDGLPVGGKSITSAGKAGKSRQLHGLMEEKSISAWKKTIARLEKNLPLGKEYGALLVEDALNCLLIGDVKADDLFSLDRQADNFIYACLVAGFTTGVRESGRAVQRATSDRQMSKLSEKIRPLLGGEWDAMRKHIDGMDVDQSIDFIKEIVQNGEMSKEVKEMVYQYLGARIHNIAREKAWDKKDRGEDNDVDKATGGEDSPRAEEGRQKQPFTAPADGVAPGTRVSPVQAATPGADIQAPARLSSGDRINSEQWIARRMGMLKKNGYNAARLPVLPPPSALRRPARASKSGRQKKRKR